MEAEAARWIKANYQAPVVGFIAGQTWRLPDAVWVMQVQLSEERRYCCSKNENHGRNGIEVVQSPADIGATMAKVVKV